MRIIECSPYPAVPQQINLVERVSNSLTYGWSWFAQIKADARGIEALRKNLDDKYTLIHNLRLPGLEAWIPLVLVGPPGVFVLSVTPAAGIFRARGESWASVDAQRRYRSVRPNLILDTAGLAKAVRDYLTRQGVPDLTVEPVLLCTHPGTHVETVRPVTRVVLSDALERFAAGLPQSGQVLTTVELDEIVDFLENPPELKKRESPAGMLDGAAERPAALSLQPAPKKSSIFGQMNLTRKQMIILAALGGFNALVLIGVIIYILVNL